MSMHGLNNLIDNNVQHQRLDDINNNDNINVQLERQRQHPHYNLIDIQYLIATSYNHHVNSTYALI